MNNTFDIHIINGIIDRYFSANNLESKALYSVISTVIAELQVDFSNDNYGIIRDMIETDSLSDFAFKNAENCCSTHVVRKSNVVYKQYVKQTNCAVCGDIYATPSQRHNGESRCYLHD